MPPIWFCLDCKGIAYGWASGRPCIYCGSSHVVTTYPTSDSEESVPDYHLLSLSKRQWLELEAEAILAGKSPHEQLAEREQAEVILIRDEPVEHGKLTLLKTNLENPEASG